MVENFETDIKLGLSFVWLRLRNILTERFVVCGGGENSYMLLRAPTRVRCSLRGFFGLI